MLSGLLGQKHLAIVSKASTLLALVLLCGVLAKLTLQLLDQFATPMPSSEKTLPATNPPAKKTPSYDITSIQSANRRCSIQ